MRRNSFKRFYMKRKNLLAWPSNRHFDISTKFYPITTVNSIHVSIRYIPMSWKLKTPQCSISPSYLYIYNILLKLDTYSKITIQLCDKRDDFDFSVVNLHYLCSNILSSFASRSWFGMQELVRQSVSNYRQPVRIRVRIYSPLPLVCRKRRQMRPEKPRSRVTAGVAQ
jgi:hypothetical protein